MANIKEIIQSYINPIAQTHYSIKHGVCKRLYGRKWCEWEKKNCGNFDNDYEAWTKTLGDKFFDMGTILRLGCVIERSLKQYYMDKKGYTNLKEFKDNEKDLHKAGNIFQRIKEPKKDKKTDGVIILYKIELGYDLTTNPDLKNIQEIMINRHLYAHNSGLIDEKYISDIKEITGEDLRSKFIEAGYPDEDVYWFKPLEQLGNYIEATKNFFEAFP